MPTHGAAYAAVAVSAPVDQWEGDEALVPAVELPTLEGLIVPRNYLGRFPRTDGVHRVRHTGPKKNMNSGTAGCLSAVRVRLLSCHCPSVGVCLPGSLCCSRRATRPS
jgi:hypothetical protein